MPTVTALKGMFQNQISPSDDSEFLRLLTEADMRLLEFGRWGWTRTKATLTPVEGIITLPTTYASILGARVGKGPVDVFDQDYEFCPGGPGEIDLGHGHSKLIDQGMCSVETGVGSITASAVLDPSGVNNAIRLVATVTGADGNLISCTIESPAETESLSISVSGKAITVIPGNGTLEGLTIVQTAGGPPDFTSNPDIAGTGATGRHYYNEDGLPFDGITVRNFPVYWNPEVSKWIIAAEAASDESLPSDRMESSENVSEPWLVMTWTAVGEADFANCEVLVTRRGSGVSTAAEVISALNANTNVAALVTASNDTGHDGSGAVGVVGETFLTGGVTGFEDRRRYKVTGYLADDEVVTALLHYAPVTLMDPDIADSMVPDDATVNTRCPDSTALKLMMLGILMEEAHDHGGARSFISDALKGLDNKEQAQRGGAQRTIQARPMGRNVRRIRGWR